ncbi:cytochrome P450 [Lentinula raphanica]|nr:cytochrome P450 [Lentinula raphanica]
MSYAILVLFIVSLFILYTRRKSRQYPLPPGPRKLPIVENLFDIPTGGFIWLDYAKLCQKCNSDIIHLGALGNSIIILNSAKTVSDILEKRPLVSAGRPPATMLGELMGWGGAVIFRSFDDFCKAQRRMISQGIPPTDPKRFHTKQISATHDLLRVLPQSDNVMRSLQIWAAEFIMDVTYGLDKEEAQKYLPTALEALDSMSEAGTPGAFYVDQIPILKYVPEWFPGAGFKRKAREWSDLRIRMTETPFNATKERMAKGIAKPSFTLTALEQLNETQDSTNQIEVIKNASVAVYGGGTHAVFFSIRSLIICMLMNPEIQSKAHEQLQKVLGPGDLPTFSDEPSLPYITAIALEAVRLHPVTPLGFPHTLSQDEIYDGYFLPKDSIIMPNVWSILHNEEDYPEPYQFKPERYLGADGRIDPKVKDPTTAAFGFGRRVCLGKHIALASLWISVASILTCYTIEPELDEDGKPMKPRAEWYPGPTLFNHPLPFKCRFVPRSKDIETSLGVGAM